MKKRLGRIDVASKKREILERLAAAPAAAVDEPAYERLRAEFAGVSERTLRAALIESGVPLSPLVEGVRQESLEELERTLRALAAEYESGDAARRMQVRELVLTAKTRAGWAARNPKVAPEKRALKEEMVLWLRTWLEDPPLFTVWVELRRRVVKGP